MRRLAILIVVSALAACDAATGELTISSAEIRPLLSGRDVTAAHMIITGGAEDDVLLGVRSDATDVIELHLSERVDNISRMRRLDTIPIPAGEDVVLEPGGLHLMLFGLEPGEIGDGLPVVMEFRDRGEISVVLEAGEE